MRINKIQCNFILGCVESALPWNNMLKYLSNLNELPIFSYDFFHCFTRMNKSLLVNDFVSNRSMNEQW